MKRITKANPSLRIGLWQFDPDDINLTNLAQGCFQDLYQAGTMLRCFLNWRSFLLVILCDQHLA